MFRNLGVLALAGSMLLSTTAYAAGASQGALAQGKPASVKQAESYDSRTPLCWLLGAGVVIGGIVLLASGNGKVVEHSTCALGAVNCPIVPVTTTTHPVITTTTTSGTGAP
jgi:hypothetical protein